VISPPLGKETEKKGVFPGLSPSYCPITKRGKAKEKREKGGEPIPHVWVSAAGRKKKRKNAEKKKGKRKKMTHGVALAPHESVQGEGGNGGRPGPATKRKKQKIVVLALLLSVGEMPIEEKGDTEKKREMSGPRISSSSRLSHEKKGKERLVDWQVAPKKRDAGGKKNTAPLV